MKSWIALALLVSVSHGDSSLPRGDAGTARGSGAETRVAGPAPREPLTAHRLAGPRSLRDLCRDATCLNITRDDDAMAPFLDARLVEDAQHRRRLALETARGWFLDERPLTSPAAGDLRPASLHRGAPGVFVLVTGWRSDVIGAPAERDVCEQLLVACVLDGKGRPVCAPGVRAAVDPSCGSDERTMLDWGLGPVIDRDGRFTFAGRRYTVVSR